MTLASMDYQAIFKIVPEVFLILDTNRKIIDASDAYFKSTKSLEKDVVNKDIMELYHNKIQIEDLDNICKSIEQVIATGKEHEIEIKIKMSTSAKHSTQYLKISHTPVFAENNNLSYIVHHVTDITELSVIKKIEREEIKLTEKLITHTSEMETELLRQMQELEARNQELQRINSELSKSEFFKSRLATIVESSEDAIITISLDGLIETWNAGAKKLYGYISNEIIGKPFSILFPENRMVEHKNIMRQIDNARSVHYTDTECKHKRGHNIPISVTISPIKNDRLQVIGACSIARDFSEFKRNQSLIKKNKELEEMSKLKNQLIANVSHELRTPLHCILGYSELLALDKTHPLTDKQQEYLNNILNSCKHLTAVINDILDLAKIEAGKMKLSPTEIDTHELINEVKIIFQNALMKKNLTLICQEDPALKFIYHDREKIKQIIYNYLSNAIKFTPSDGKITLITQSEQNNYFRLAIKDTGIGISEENLSKLFIEFQQLDDSNTKSYQGTGLGLSIVKKIATMLGGSVGVESKPHEGSCFFVILPCQFKETLSNDSSDTN